jgi:hypothetical protein
MLGNTLGGSLLIGVSGIRFEEIHRWSTEQRTEYFEILIGYLLIGVTIVGWGRYMQWMYPVEVRFTNKGTFKAAGAVEAAASL